MHQPFSAVVLNGITNECTKRFHYLNVILFRMLFCQTPQCIDTTKPNRESGLPSISAPFW